MSAPRRIAHAERCWSRKGDLRCEYPPGHVGVWHRAQGENWTDSNLDEGEPVIRDLSDWEPEGAA